MNGHRPVYVGMGKYAMPSAKGEAIMNLLKRAALLLASAALVSGGAGIAFAAQPGQSCEDNPTPPGNASSASGSAFNPDGNAGTHYAGSPGTHSLNSGNSHAVSQYDVACTTNQSN